MSESNPPNPPSAPVELWQAIFDDLDSEQDKRTLVACSLSCKTLLAPSYRRLYHHITLASSAGAQHFVTTIRSQSQNQPAAYVRCLSILCRDIPPSDLNSIIPVLAQSLPAVSILRLDALHWSQIDRSAQSALTSGFQTVQQLELSEVVFESEDQALEFIVSFPSLTHLMRQSRDFPFDEPAPPPRPIPLPAGLKALDISTDYVEMFDGLLRLEPHPNLHTLRVNFIDMRDEYVGPVGHLLEFLGPSLESLTFYGWIDMAWDRTSPNLNDNLLIGHPINLAQNTNLRSLTLYCGIFYNWLDDEPFPEYKPSVFWALALLSQITSAHVSKIKLRMEVSGPAALSQMDWIRLDEILSKSLWRYSLKQVVINIIRPGYMLLAAGDLDRVRLSLPTISAAQSVSLTIDSSKISELDGYV